MKTKAARVLLRIPPALHEEIKKEAARLGISVNAAFIMRLQPVKGSIK